jgi:hypothetical protein
MTPGDLVRTSFGNLGRHRVRTLLSAVGVTVGILTIVTMLSLGIGVQQEVVSTFESAGLETIRVYPVTEERSVFTQFDEPRRTLLITPALVEEMRARDDVLEARPRVRLPWSINVSLRVGEEMLEVSVGEFHWGVGDPFEPPPRLVAGRELADGAPGEIVVSAGALEELRWCSGRRAARARASPSASSACWRPPTAPKAVTSAPR